jgi:hypothetical protein
MRARTRPQNASVVSSSFWHNFFCGGVGQAGFLAEDHRKNVSGRPSFQQLKQDSIDRKII